MVVIYIIATVAFSSCTYNKTVPQPAYALPETVSFSKNLIPMFNQYCNTGGCHSTLSSTHLDLIDSVAYSSLFARHDVDTINPSNSPLYVSMNSVNPTMPPSGRLSDYYVALVLKWIKQKGRDN